MSPDQTVGTGSWPPHDPTSAPAPPPPTPTDQPAQWAPPPPTAPPPPDQPGPWGAPPPSMPPPVAVVEPPRWRSLSGLASALTVLFWLAAADAVFAIVAFANRIHFINDILRGGIPSDFASRRDDSDHLVGASVVIMLVLGLVIFVLFVIWFWRAAKNNEALGRFGARLGPGWAIGGWFIPFANLVIPVLILQDLWRGADPEVPRGDPNWRTRRGSGLVGWYWAAYIVSFLRFGAGRTKANPLRSVEMRGLRTHDVVAIVGMAFGVAAAVLAVFLVKGLTARQEQCLRAQQAAWHQANPA